jgi:hypothetical protein
MERPRCLSCDIRTGLVAAICVWVATAGYLTYKSAFTISLFLPNLATVLCLFFGLYVVLNESVGGLFVFMLLNLVQYVQNTVFVILFMHSGRLAEYVQQGSQSVGNSNGVNITNSVLAAETIVWGFIIFQGFLTLIVGIYSLNYFNYLRSNKLIV